jgi:hypothetical protein
MFYVLQARDPLAGQPVGAVRMVSDQDASAG